MRQSQASEGLMSGCLEPAQLPLNECSAPLLVGRDSCLTALVRLEGILLSTIDIPDDSGPDRAEEVTGEGMCWFCNVLAWLRLFLEALRRIMAMRFLLSRASADIREAVDVSTFGVFAPTREENVVVIC